MKLNGRRLTTKEMAKLLGVSRTTLSRVLNNSDKVSEKTKKRVLNLLEKYGYKVNYLAQSLVRGKTMFVGVIVPLMNTTFFPEIIEGIEKVLEVEGFSVLYYQAKNNALRERKMFDFLLSLRVDALAVAPVVDSILGPYIMEELKRGIPIVLFDRVLSGWNGPAVVSDNRLGIKLALNYLLSLGYKNIAFVGEVNSKLSSVRERLQAYASFSLELEIPQILLDTSGKGENGFEMGYRIGEEVFSRKFRFGAMKLQAFICSDDTIAIGLMKALLQKGVSIPGDVAVVGFDDLEIGRYFHPSLTTIAQDRFKIGERVGKLILQMLNDKKVSDTIIRIEPTLIKRESA